MKNLNQKIISKLKRLVNYVEQAKSGFENAAEEEVDAIAKEELLLLAQKRHELSVQLQQEILKLGGKPGKFSIASVSALPGIEGKAKQPEVYDKKVHVEFLELMQNVDTPYHIRTMAIVQLENMNNLMLIS